MPATLFNTVFVIAKYGSTLLAILISKIAVDIVICVGLIVKHCAVLSIIVRFYLNNIIAVFIFFGIVVSIIRLFRIVDYIAVCNEKSYTSTARRAATAGANLNRYIMLQMTA